jgi:UDP-2,4-diacetamido-2,4,6-trideoxy-beta-L-altropyranose hydrolase
MSMKVAFRVDASVAAGSGHVIRCLTLADAFRLRGAECRFISREHPGNLLDYVRQREFAVMALPAAAHDVPLAGSSEPAHASWLGCDWPSDAQQTVEALGDWRPDWIVVDHYAIDSRWEAALRPYCEKLMVVDDLADRMHDADLLLDQNLGRQPSDYAGLVPEQCAMLIGPRHALLRAEFPTLRQHSLVGRRVPQLRRLLISMGGVDQPNATGHVLHALCGSALPGDCEITVVMGGQALWMEQVRTQAQEMPWPTRVVVNVTDMAKRMCESDLAIGAAGTTSWERCCLGLPTLLVVLAENQWMGARALDAAGAAQLVGTVEDIATRLPVLIGGLDDRAKLAQMRDAACDVTEGGGVAAVLESMEAAA